MNRRGFLKLLGLAAAGALAPDLELDPERLLWVPGTKTIFDLGGIRPADLKRLNMLITPDWIARETLNVLKHQLEAVKRVNRFYDEKFPGGTVGYTVNVKLPARYGDPLVLRPGEDFITIERTT